MNDLKIFGNHDDKTIQQMLSLLQHGSVERAALLGDAHFGYSQPVGGVVGYSEHVSVSGVGLDIGCGIKATKTNLVYRDLVALGKPRIADEMASKIAFGVGRVADVQTDHALFDSDAWGVLRDVAGTHKHDQLFANARKQLGTVGGGNHWGAVWVEGDNPDCSEDAPVWITTHFGSRGLGHNIATGFLKLDASLKFDGKPGKGERIEKEEPTLFELGTDNATAYLELMHLCGQYAYAGRDIVVQQVLDILGAEEVDSVHNHHNYSFTETHGGKELQVTRKGATPLAPGQRGAVGGSMCDIAVIVKGVGSPIKSAATGEVVSYAIHEEQNDTMMSTVHGAGRVMSRTEAKGKRKYRTNELVLNPDGTPKKSGRVTEEMMARSVADFGIELRGGFLDESAFCYRPLRDVLAVHANTAEVETVLVPKIVCMAPANIKDPFKD